MGTGKTGSGLRAGLLLLTALTSTVPAMAQERGGWGGRGGMERGAGNNGGGGGMSQRGNGNPGGGEARGWRGNGGAAATTPQPVAQAPVQVPVQPSVQPGARADTRNWQGNSGRQWQSATPRVDTAPRADRNDGAARWNRQSGSERAQTGNWQNRDASRGDERRWNGNRGTNGLYQPRLRQFERRQPQFQSPQWRQLAGR